MKRPVSLLAPVVLATILTAGSAPRAQEPDPVDDSIFPYRSLGQATAVQEWPGGSTVAAQLSEDNNRLRLVNRRSWLVNENGEPDLDVLAPAPPIAIAYTNLRGAPFTYRTAKLDLAWFDEGCFYHSTDPASLVAHALPYNQIDIYWMPDRRYSLFSTSGEESPDPIGTAVIMRSVDGGPFVELAVVTVTPPGVQTYQDTNNIQLASTYRYRILSGTSAATALQYSDDVSITYTQPATAQPAFWIKGLSAPLPPRGGGPVAINVTVGSYQPGVSQPCPCVIRLKAPEAKSTDEPLPGQAMTWTRDGPLSDYWTYSFTTTDEVPAAFRGPHAFAFESGSPCSASLFNGSFFTTLPNNRLALREWATYLLNPGSATTVAATIAEADSLVSQLGPPTRRYDGIFGDSAEPWFTSSTTNIVPREPISQYGAHLVSMMGAVHDHLGLSDKKMIVNGARTAFANACDGVEQEGFAYTLTYGTVVTCNAFIQQLTQMQQATVLWPEGQVLALTDYPQLFLDGEGQDPVLDRGPSRLYVLGAYLLVAEDNTLLLAANTDRGDGRVSFYPEWQIGLGAALGPVALPPPMWQEGDKIVYDNVCYVDQYIGNNGLLVRLFEHGAVALNFRDYITDQTVITYEVPSVPSMYKVCVDNEKEQIFDGGRFWTEPVSGSVQIPSGRALILVDQPITSPSLDDPRSLTDIYLDNTSPWYISAKLKSWDMSRVWAEIDARAIGGSESVVLRDNGQYPDAYADDDVYVSAVLALNAPAIGTYKLPLYVRDDSGFALFDSLSVSVYEHAPGAKYRDRSAESGITYGDGEPYSAAFLYAGGSNDPWQDLVITMKNREGYMFVCDNVTTGVPHFQEVTVPTFGGTRPASGSRGISTVDYNNDGRTDIFVAHEASVRLYQHNGDGTFTDYASASGLLSWAGDSWVGAWDSFDGAPLPSVLIGRWGYAGQDPTPEQQGPLLQYELLKGVTDGTVGGGVRFDRVTESVGLIDAEGTATTAAMWMPVEAGQRNYLAVGNLKGRARVFKNIEGAGGGRQFVDIYAQLTPGQYEGLLDKVSAWTTLDYEPDGDQDVMIGRWDPGFNTLCLRLLGNDSGTLNLRLQGVVGANTSVPVSGLLSFDYDLDADIDVLALPGATAPVGLWANKEPNWNLVFENVSGKTGLHEGATSGCAAADFNGDGAMELYLGRSTSVSAENHFFYCATDLSSAMRVYRNGLRVKVVGNGYDSNKGATGARVTFATNDGVAAPVIMAQHIDGGSGRGTQASRILHFGTGSHSRNVKATVVWPNGRVQVDSSLVTSVNLPLYTISEPANAPAIVTGSVQFQYAARPGGWATWTFRWRTTGSTNPLLDRVVVYDPPGQSEPCQQGTYELRDNQLGVSVTVEPSPLGGYQHTLVWEDGPCVGYSGCSYRYKVYSKNGGQEVASAERSLTLGACLE